MARRCCTTTFSTASAKPLFDLLGTPPAAKRHVLFEAGHVVSLPRGPMIKETLDWFDRYLGSEREGRE